MASVDEQFARINGALYLIEQRVRRAAIRSAMYSARQIQNAAKDTDAYNDETTATRSSTMAYVPQHRDRGTEAEQIAEQYREDSGYRTIEAGEEVGDELNVGIVLTAGTFYTQYLELARGGQNAFLGPTMDEYSPIAAQRIFRTVQRLFRKFNLQQMLEDGDD